MEGLEQQHITHVFVVILIMMNIVSSSWSYSPVSQEGGKALASPTSMPSSSAPVSQGGERDLASPATMPSLSAVV